jgi:predicted DNA-binding protein YlxM (UPF0122 family)
MKELIDRLRDIFTMQEIADIAGTSRQYIYDLTKLDSEDSLTNKDIVSKLKRLNSYIDKCSNATKEALYELILNDLIEKNITLQQEENVITNIKNAISILSENNIVSPNIEKETWHVIADIEGRIDDKQLFQSDKNSVFVLKTFADMYRKVNLIPFDVKKYQEYILTNKVNPHKLILIGSVYANALASSFGSFCTEEVNIDSFQTINNASGTIKKTPDNKIYHIVGDTEEDTLELTKFFVQKYLLQQ